MVDCVVVRGGEETGGGVVDGEIFDGGFVADKVNGGCCLSSSVGGREGGVSGVGP